MSEERKQLRELPQPRTSTSPAIIRSLPLARPTESSGELRRPGPLTPRSQSISTPRTPTVTEPRNPSASAPQRQAVSVSRAPSTAASRSQIVAAPKAAVARVTPPLGMRPISQVQQMQGSQFLALQSLGNSNETTQAELQAVSRVQALPQETAKTESQQVETQPSNVIVATESVQAEKSVSRAEETAAQQPEVHAEETVARNTEVQAETNRDVTTAVVLRAVEKPSLAADTVVLRAVEKPSANTADSRIVEKASLAADTVVTRAVSRATDAAVARVVEKATDAAVSRATEKSVSHGSNTRSAALEELEQRIVRQLEQRVRRELEDGSFRKSIEDKLTKLLEERILKTVEARLRYLVDAALDDLLPAALDQREHQQRIARSEQNNPIVSADLRRSDRHQTVSVGLRRSDQHPVVSADLRRSDRHQAVSAVSKQAQETSASLSAAATLDTSFTEQDRHVVLSGEIPATIADTTKMAAIQPTPSVQPEPTVDVSAVQNSEFVQSEKSTPREVPIHQSPLPSVNSELPTLPSTHSAELRALERSFYQNVDSAETDPKSAIPAYRVRTQRVPQLVVWKAMQKEQQEALPEHKTKSSLFSMKTLFSGILVGLFLSGGVAIGTMIALSHKIPSPPMVLPTAALQFGFADGLQKPTETLSIAPLGAENKVQALPLEKPKERETKKRETNKKNVEQPKVSVAPANKLTETVSVTSAAKPTVVSPSVSVPAPVPTKSLKVLPREK